MNQTSFDNDFTSNTSNININIIGLDYPHFYHDSENYTNVLIAVSFNSSAFRFPLTVVFVIKFSLVCLNSNMTFMSDMHQMKNT